MKITIVSPYFPPETNGIAISVFNRAKALLNMGHDVQVVIPNYGNNINSNYYSDLLKRSGALVNTISTRKLTGFRTKQFPSFMKSGNEIAAWVESFGPQIVMVDDPFIFLLGAGYLPLRRYIKQGNVISVGLCHADVPTTLKKFRKPILAELAKWIIPYAYNKFNLTVFTSHYLKQCYPKIINGYPVAFLGVDKEYFQYSPREIKKETVDILYVGRLEPDKDIDFLYEAALKYNKPQTNKRIIWHFVGDGSQLSYWLTKQTSHIIFHGFFEPQNILGQYYNSDIFVSACGIESYGLAVVEAMATGLPVLVPSTGAASSHFVNGDSGFVYDTGNIHSFMELLDYLVNKNEIRKTIGFKASKRTISWADATQNLLTVILDSHNGK